MGFDCSCYRRDHKNGGMGIIVIVIIILLFCFTGEDDNSPSIY